MFGINDMRAYLEAQTGEKFYPLGFPASAPSDCSAVSFDGGSPAKAGISRTNLQIITRADHPATAEQKALQIKQFLDGKTNFDVGAAHVLFISAANPFPLYLGTDGNGLFSYSMNYEMLLEV